jgi:hypothetical protein
MYPWIGAGTERLFTLLRNSPKKQFLVAGSLVLFLIIPVYKSVKPLWRQDAVIKETGEWLAKDPRFQKAKIMCNDARIPFYAGRGRDYLGYIKSDHLFSEQLALLEQVDLIIIETPIKKRDLLPEFKHYKKLKEFQGKKNVAILYGSPSFVFP